MEFNFFAVIYFIWWICWMLILSEEIWRDGKMWYRFEIWNENFGIDKDSNISVLTMFLYVLGGWYIVGWFLMQLGWEVAK